MSEQFKCFQCGRYFDSMWGDTCNSCRAQNEKHNELIKTIKEKDSIQELKKQKKELMEFVKRAKASASLLDIYISAKELIEKYGE